MRGGRPGGFGSRRCQPQPHHHGISDLHGHPDRDPPLPLSRAAHDLSRGLRLVKWLLAIPHYIVLFFLTIGAVLAVIVAWFPILFTGRYPLGSP
jgi:hypothetical protein